jgi:hypothetical protein
MDFIVTLVVKVCVEEGVLQISHHSLDLSQIVSCF